MIRINLVAPERKAKDKDKGPALPAGSVQSYLLLALFAGGALVLCAGAWWLQSNKLRDLDTRIAADEKRQRDLQAIAPTDEAEAKVKMLRQFDPISTPDDYDVPDPYYGGPDRFDHVIDLVEAACRGLLDEVLAGTAP